ncbi:hypothetical protein Trco_001604 [Trichoderma cornu-damae]|uniref:Uncharacterized protein n=1 Tax=Trichoderma cornu-damae TaxID=654480 RepID=A0A9P8U024_9HYPO|nr:hypothetical protein Trco_001604 [Trichoderma cornu-damae]
MTPFVPFGPDGRGRRRRQDVGIAAGGSPRHGSLGGELHGRLAAVSREIEDEPSGDDFRGGRALSAVAAIHVFVGSGCVGGCDASVFVNAALVLVLLLNMLVLALILVLMLVLVLVLVLMLVLVLSVERDSPERLLGIGSPVGPGVEIVIQLDDAVDDGDLLAFRAGDVDGSHLIAARRRIAAATTKTVLAVGQRLRAGFAAAADAVLGDEEVGYPEEDVEQDEDADGDGYGEVDGQRLWVVDWSGRHDF